MPPQGLTGLGLGSTSPVLMALLLPTTRTRVIQVKQKALRGHNYPGIPEGLGGYLPVLSQGLAPVISGACPRLVAGHTRKTKPGELLTMTQAGSWPITAEPATSRICDPGWGLRYSVKGPTRA